MLASSTTHALRPGMIVEVRVVIETQQRNDGAETALVPRPDGLIVFKIVDGKRSS